MEGFSHVPNGACHYTLRVIVSFPSPIDHLSDTMAQPCRNPVDSNNAVRSVPSPPRSRSPMDLSRVRGQVEPGQTCAYNQSRECFLGLNVVAGDFSPASFQEWLATLKPNSGAGMWMVPFRGILAPEVSTPLDLLYLDADNCVLEAVEFFPTFRVSPATPPAASVLALPAHSIFSTQTQAGDLLLLFRADEMEWRLERLARTGTAAGSFAPVSNPVLRPILVRDEPKTPPAPVPVPEQPKERTAPPIVQAEPAVEVPAVPQTQVKQPEPQQAGQTKPTKPWMDPARLPAKSGLGKLASWIFPAAPDPRKTLRRPVDGVVAHFFTGGAPEPHEIRDVSPTGLFVVTTERWYPGTIIRMTLTRTDSTQSLADRSITVHARSVRWGNDGVGLEFVVEPGKQSRGQLSALDPADIRRLNQFLKQALSSNK